MSNQVLVSVCVIVYNHGNFIKECLDGIVSQDYPNIELIISNDASADNTHQKIESFLNGRNYSKKIKVKYFNHEKNLGICPNLNFALKQCTGDYIAICEGDDYWVSRNKLSVQVQSIENTNFSASFHDVQYKKNGMFFESFIYDFAGVNSKGLEVVTLKELMNLKWLVPTCSFFFKRNCLELPYFFEELKFGDFPLFCSIAAKGDFLLLHGINAVYRMDNPGSQINQVDPLGSVVKHLDFIRFLSWLKKESDLEEIDIRIQFHISKSKGDLISFKHSGTYKLSIRLQKFLRKIIWN